MADHLPHSEAIFSVRSVQLGDQVVKITEAQGPDAGIVGCLAREPNGRRKAYGEYT